MPSRRTLLTGAAAAGATALAGCSTGDALDPATQGTRRLPPRTRRSSPRPSGRSTPTRRTARSGSRPPSTNARPATGPNSTSSPTTG
ncbi:hypothetical protein [Halosegnis marinus]|uniref:hypothetical protein n=1 Tax=Halosegnis marinus TaxID=3034023 RepID=UPI00361ACDF9